MWSDVRSEGGVWEVLAAFCDEPMRQLVPLNRSWAALARDDESALWRVLLRRLPGLRGVYATRAAADVVKSESPTWRAAFAELHGERFAWEASGDEGATKAFRVRVAARFRPVVDGAGGDREVTRVVMPLHQRLAALRAQAKGGAFDRKAALRRIACDDENRTPAESNFQVLAKKDVAKKTEEETAEEAAPPASSAERGASILRVDADTGEVLTIAPGCGLRSFSFDGGVFGEKVDQGDIYDSLARPLVADLVNGRNGTLFAFGQTGSGKTHSVFGSRERPGVVPRVFDEALAARVRGFRTELSLAYVEIDGDDLVDLLAEKSRVAQNGAAAARWVLEGHASVPVPDATTARRLLDEGDARRKRAATKMNERSSRAHTVLAITLVRRADGDGGEATRATLFVADLGGSEQLKRSKADGAVVKAAGRKDGSEGGADWAEYYKQRERLMEAQRINLGLFALKRVVEALRRGATHVPFSDSKLTQLLRPGLGGGCRTACLVCAAPEDANAAETVQALRFGERAAGLETIQHGGLALSRALEALDARIANVERAIKAKERWEERTRVVTSQVAAYDDMDGGAWGAGAFEKKKGKWVRDENHLTDRDVVQHTVVGKVLVGAEAERRDLEALLAERAKLIAASA